MTRNGRIWKIISFCLLNAGIFFLCLAASFAKEAPSVNVLTWWGYLDRELVKKEVKNNCNANISVDEYYSNTEFLRRWREKRVHYDIIIFSETILDAIKREVAIKNSQLYKKASGYNKYIRAQYLKRKYPENVVYFSHSITGFLLNRQALSLDEKDTIYTIFRKAGNRLVVLIDDPVEANLLVNRGLGKTDSSISVQNLKDLTQDTIVYITNDYEAIYKKPEFAFAYVWSGEALGRLKKPNNKYTARGHNLRFS